MGPIERTLMIGGRVYVLSTGGVAVAALEAKLGRSYDDVLREAQAGSEPAVFTLFWSLLQRHHPDLDITQAGELLEQFIDEGGSFPALIH